MISDFDAGATVDTWELPTMDQNALEFETLLELLAQLDQESPLHSIVEVGVMYGGTLARFADNFPDARVIGIDPSPQVDELNGVMSHYRNARFVRGHSQTDRTRAIAVDHAGGAFDVAFVDGDHSLPAVRADWEWLRGCTRRLIAFHDVARTTEPCEVYKLWRELRADPELRTAELNFEPEDVCGIGLVWIEGA